MAEQPLRRGDLGAARIAPMALVGPARRVPGVEVLAVAARDRTRAEAFAARHRIPRVHPTYEALIADPEIEAIYNPLPNSLHAPWTIRALEAGKHVLCEKPFSATVAEAQAMADAAARSGRVLMEAFHYRYHALFARMRALLRAGEIGAMQHLDARDATRRPQQCHGRDACRSEDAETKRLLRHSRQSQEAGRVATCHQVDRPGWQTAAECSTATNR